MKDFKRVEMYLGWKCNFNCCFCIEMPTIKKMWNIRITERDLLKRLLLLKKQGYNHVTFLGGEPFIQDNCLFALKIAKKLGYTILVTTNASLLQNEIFAKKVLSYIDELIVSLHTVDKNLQVKINNTIVPIDFDKVFSNINKYWTGSFLKINTVVNPLNINYLDPIRMFMNKYGVKEISFTYPDIYRMYYSKEYIYKYIALEYDFYISKIKKVVLNCVNDGINVKITDIPFCFLPDESWIKFTDDFDYSGRTKIMYNDQKYDRIGTFDFANLSDNLYTEDNEKYSPRMRNHIQKCNLCKHKKMCWGVSRHYEELFGLEKIKPYKNE